MRVSELWIPTESQRDGAPDLLVRAGYTHRLADGLYSLLPLGQRVLQRIGAIVRRRLSELGAQEVTLPLLQPAELWTRPSSAGESRAQAFGSQLLRVEASPGETLVLSPTHEEVAALVAAACI